MTRSRSATLLALILVGGIALKGVLIALEAVPFNGDEAVVALMARHILCGARPWFFYGQAYMGSLDAYLVAGAFALLGESVLAVRVVQTALFAAILLTSYLVARRFTRSSRTALFTVLLLAFPPVLLTLYTTASLGGYGEALLAGNLLLWLGHRLRYEDRDRPLAWACWGLVAGLGFWAFGLVLVYVVPVFLWLLWPALDPRQKPVPRRLPSMSKIGLLVLAAAAGSLPWWLGNLQQVDVGVGELLGTAVRSTAAADTFLGNVADRVFNFVALGLPALFGLRYPWSVDGPPLWLAVPALALYLGALGYAARRALQSPAPVTSSRPSPASLRSLRRTDYVPLWGIWAMLFLGFALTPFGGDPSGRYFLPLYLPLFIFTGNALTRLQAQVGRWTWLLLATVLAFNLTGTAQAALDNLPGITTQFDPISQVDHHHYDELIAFLHQQGETRGYTNYWVAYPLAFLSDEEIILLPRLPYKADMRYTPRDDRYAPYDDVVAASPTAVYVTSNHPALDRLLRQQFTELGVRFEEKQISSYRVFYDLSRHVKPTKLSIQPGS